MPARLRLKICIQSHMRQVTCEPERVKLVSRAPREEFEAGAAWMGAWSLNALGLRRSSLIQMTRRGSVWSIASPDHFQVGVRSSQGVVNLGDEIEGFTLDKSRPMGPATYLKVGEALKLPRAVHLALNCSRRGRLRWASRASRRVATRNSSACRIGGAWMWPLGQAIRRSALCKVGTMIAWPQRVYDLIGGMQRWSCSAACQAMA